MGNNVEAKGVRKLDKKAMKKTKGGIIAILRAAPTDGTTTSDLTVRKAGDKPLEY